MSRVLNNLKAAPNFICFHDTVLVEPIPRNTTAGGVHLPETADMGPQQARVIACGPGWPTEHGTRIAMDVVVGDLIWLTLTAQPHKIVLDGKTYVITRMRDLIGKVGASQDCPITLAERIRKHHV